MKKKIFMLMILMMVMVYVPSVLAVGEGGLVDNNDVTACSSVLSNVSIDPKLPNTVHMIIVIIQIAVPILLVVFGMMDLVKAVMAGKEDEIKKGQQTFIKRIIAAAIVFFVIVVVKFVISLVADSDNKAGIISCANCFLKGAQSGACSSN